MPAELLPVTNSAPERLATRALIEGILPPPVASSRVIEIASGAGENLIPLAFWSPEMNFWGFDSDPKKLEASRLQAKVLKIENVQFTSSESSLEPNSFDYVLIGNIFPFINNDIKRRILRIAQELLKPKGLLFVRYASKSGTLKRKELRRLLQPIIEQDSPDIGREIFEMMTVISSLKPQNERQSEAQLECKLLLANGLIGAQEQLQLHQIIPLDPSEMKELASEYQFSFVQEMNNAGLGSRRELHVLRKTLEKRAPSSIDIDDLIDFFACPDHREEVYCFAKHREQSRVSLEQMLDLLLVESDLSTVRPDVNLKPGIEVGFKTRDGNLARSRIPLEKAILKHLCLSHGKVTPLRNIIEAAWRDAEEAEGKPIIPREPKIAELVQGVIGLADQGVLKLCLREKKMMPQNEVIPTVTRWQAELGHVLSTEDHSIVVVDDLTRALILELSDGRRQDELLEFVEQLIQTGALAFDEKIAQKSVEEQRKVIRRSIDEAVQTLTRIGLLKNLTSQELSPALPE